MTMNNANLSRILPPDKRVSRAGRGWLFDVLWLAIELLWRLYTNKHVEDSIPAFRVQRVKNLSGDACS